MTTTSPLLPEALAAHAAGLAVLPPRQDGTKRPDSTTWKQAQAQRPDEATIRTWYANGRTGLGVICGKVSGNLELLELDHPAAGHDRRGTWQAYYAAATAAGLGDLVDRVALGYAETTPSGGMHILYRCTDPVDGNTKLAQRDALDTELTDAEADARAAGHRIVRVIFETRGEGGYVVVAPSHGTVHPTGGAWTRVAGSFATIATITGEERRQLLDLARTFDHTPEPPAAVVGTPTAGSSRGTSSSWMDQTCAAFNDATTWAQILEPHGWRHDGDRAGIGYWVRPGKDPKDGHSATTNANGTDRLILWSSSVTIPGIDTARGGGHAPSYDRFAVWAGYHHGGDRQAAAEAARRSGIGPAWTDRPTHDDVDLDALLGRTTPAAHPDPAPATHLPEVFWNARPALEHIRQAARHRLLGPDAVLGAVLARVAAITPHTVELPAIVGSACGLTFYAALVGPPQAGKSKSADLAAELLPAPPSILDRIPLGSGEGFVEMLFEMVEETTDGGKTKAVKKQTRHGSIWHVDEGQILTDIAARQGATILPTLRSAFSHGTLGQANASMEKRRILDGRLYVYGVTLGIQPELAGPLLADAAGGTPQRFLWLDCGDPTPDDRAEHPGELRWTPPGAGALEPHAITRGGWRRHQLAVADHIVAEIRADRIAVLTGDQRDPSEAHRMLLRLKAAAILALLDGRLDVDGEDWTLAGMLVDTSAAVRTSVVGALTAVEHQRAAAADARAVMRDARLEGGQEARALASATKSAARVLARHLVDEIHFAEGGGCTSRCIAQSMASRYRKVVSVDEVVDELVAKGWGQVENGRIHPGESRPA